MKVYAFAFDGVEFYICIKIYSEFDCSNLTQQLQYSLFCFTIKINLKEDQMLQNLALRHTNANACRLKCAKYGIRVLLLIRNCPKVCQHVTVILWSISKQFSIDK